MTDVVHCPATRQEQILLPLADDALREFAQHLPPPADHIKIEGIARHEVSLARPAWVAADDWLALGRSHWPVGSLPVCHLWAHWPLSHTRIGYGWGDKVCHGGVGGIAKFAWVAWVG